MNSRWNIAEPGIYRSMLRLGFVLASMLFATALQAAPLPFSDNTEGGGGQWQADAYSWALTTEDAYSATHSWTDSPGGVYANNSNVALTLAVPLDIYTAIRPQLVFRHKYLIETGYDFGYLEISTDHGTSWQQLAAFSGVQNTWKKEVFDLSAYVVAGASTQALIRFRLLSDKTVRWDGWHIDDIVIGDPPSAVASFTVGNPTGGSLDISWSKNLDANFASYALHRTQHPGVTESDPLIASFTTVDSYSFTDTGLVPGVTYYYKLFVTNTLGLTTASKDAYASTVAGSVAYPFFDNMENGTGSWNAATPWGIDVGFDHLNNPAGHFWSDSPGAGVNYAPNVNTSLTLDIDLTQATRPVLSFWQRYNTEVQYDWGLVEVSTNGGSNWTTIHTTNGNSQTNWEQVRVDLTEFARRVIRLRFRFDANGAGVQADGWQIDDISVAEQTAGSTAYPFSDSFDTYSSLMNNWVTGNDAGGVHFSAVDGHGLPPGAAAFPWNTATHQAAGAWEHIDMTLAHPIDLTMANKPQLVFWAKRQIDGDSHFYVQVSTNGGISWANLYDQSNWWPNPAYWSRLQFDLSAYANSNKVLIRFQLYTNGWNDTLLIDDVRIADAPADVVQTQPVVHAANPQNAADLRWTQTVNPYDFQAYEIRRSTSAGVNRSSTLVATITDPYTTSYVDNTLNPGITYYYKVFVLENIPNSTLVSPGSNEMVVTTSDFSNSITHRSTYPFVDVVDAYSVDANSTSWSWQQPWGLDTGLDHTGNPAGVFWSDSPGVGVNYAADANTSLTLNLDLTLASRPILSFWQRYNTEVQYDWGLVEVSTNGGTSWTTVHTTNGNSSAAWEQVKVDLSAFAKRPVMLRFRFDSNGPGTEADGWQVDDISVAEQTAGSTAYPFSDSFDTYSSLINNWVTGNDAGGVHFSTVDGHGLPPGAAAFPWNTATHQAAGAWEHIDMTLAHPIDLTVANKPQLVFWVKRQIEYDSHFYVQVSTNGGISWANLYDQSNWWPNPASWSRLQFDLSAYANSNKVLVRFQLYTNGWNDTLLIDDVRITDAPADVVPTQPVVHAANPQNAADLRWTQTVDPYNFQAYEIRRSTSSGVSRSSTLVATITDPYTTSYVDSSLTPGVTYYYRIFVLENLGANSSIASPGNNEMVVTAANFSTDPTHIVTVPFNDPVDVYSLSSPQTPWTAFQPWAIDRGMDHTGDPYGQFWSDSPQMFNYANNMDTSLQFHVNTLNSQRPILRFWERYQLQWNADFGYVEVSTDGGQSWHMVHHVTGGNFGSWQQVDVDLTPWISADMRIRFRLVSDGNTVYNGWDIDDVSILEQVGGNTAYPFYDDFSTTTSISSNWISGQPEGFYRSIATADNHSGTQLGGVHYNMDKDRIYDGWKNQAILTLAKPVDLTQSVNPQWDFWYKVKTYRWDSSHGILHAQVSVNNGRTWSNVWNSGQDYSGTWKHAALDLSPYKLASQVLVRFVDWNYYGGSSGSFYSIDEVRIGENPNIPRIISIASGDAQVGQRGQPLAQPMTVRVIDSNSIPQASVQVDFYVQTGQGTVSPYSMLTDAAGLASTTLTLDPYNMSNQVSATIHGTTQQVVFNASGYTPGQPVHLLKAGGDQQAADVYTQTANPLSVRVTDINGNGIIAVRVDFATISGTATPLDPYVFTDAYGYARTMLTMSATTGISTIHATASGLVGSPIAFTATAVLPGGVPGDTDGDGMPDAWETAHALNPLDAADAASDADNDGLNNLAEYGYATDPHNADSDGDGMPDGWEIAYGLNPLSPLDANQDANGNGISNLAEYLAGTIPMHLPHFATPANSPTWADVFGQVSIDGVPAPAGSEVAVYDPYGVMCGRVTVNTAGQYGFLHCYGDDPATPNVDEGAMPGDILSFRIWDAVHAVELSASTSVPAIWTMDGAVLNVNLNASAAQSIPLHVGWNLVSFSVKTAFYTGAAPTVALLPGTNLQQVASIGDVFASLTDSYGNPLYDAVRSFDVTGAHTYDPALPTFSDLRYVAGGYGYWIHMTQAANWQVNGVRAAAGDTLALSSGWNLVGYWKPDVQYTGVQPTVSFPPDVATYSLLTVMDDALVSVANKYAVVRSHDINGAHTYDPALPTFSDLRYAGPGYGYWIKMKQPGTLAW